jgi:hypothetical protein
MAAAIAAQKGSEGELAPELAADGLDLPISTPAERLVKRDALMVALQCRVLANAFRYQAMRALERWGDAGSVAGCPYRRSWAIIPGVSVLRILASSARVGYLWKGRMSAWVTRTLFSCHKHATGVTSVWRVFPRLCWCTGPDSGTQETWPP